MTNTSFLSVREVAAKFRVSDESVYRLIRSGQLRAIRIGGQWRIPEPAVADLQRSGDSALADAAAGAGESGH